MDTYDDPRKASDAHILLEAELFMQTPAVAAAIGTLIAPSCPKGATSHILRLARAFHQPLYESDYKYIAEQLRGYEWAIQGQIPIESIADEEDLARQRIYGSSWTFAGDHLIVTSRILTDILLLNRLIERSFMWNQSPYSPSAEK